MKDTYFHKFFRELFSSNKVKLHKFVFSIFLIIIFSIIYTFFDNGEFAGWINVSSMHFKKNTQKKINIFYKYAKKYKDFMAKHEFINLPIYKYNHHLIILPKYSNSQNQKIYPPLSNSIKNQLYNIYSVDNKITLNAFLDMPFHIHDKPIHQKPNITILSNDFAVKDYFDRLYYSVIVQTTLGLGDIFPSNRRLRLFTMLQALSTIFLMLI